MSDTSVAVPIADERTRRIFGDLAFSPAKRGYDPAEVTAFLVNASGAVERMLSRLKDAEERAALAEAKATQAQQRLEMAPPAPAAPPAPIEDSGLLQRTLALAEKTAVAAVSDARARAQAILTQAQEQARQYFATERQAIADEWDRVHAEANKLESLRLAVAAETMALDGVRGHLRSRIAAAAGELAQIAEDPDLLNYAVSQHQAEVEAAKAAALAAGATIEPAPRPAASTVDAINASSVSSPEKSFEAKWANTEEDVEGDEAFDRFFSDGVEPEPTQQWILAG